MKYFLLSILFFSFIAHCHPHELATQPKIMTNKMLLGAKEWVQLDDSNITIKSRIDTGATTSSISATKIKLFERDGKVWVSFCVKHKELAHQLEYPLLRETTVKQSNSLLPSKRFVVDIPITLGTISTITPFTLKDRQHMSFPMILGRSFLSGRAIVDTQLSYVQ